MDLSAPPSPLTRNERIAFTVMAIVCAASRFLAMARSLWDWDEALFCLGMRSYDVTNHHPHPPGFPIYIALGHLAKIFTHSDFRALQAVNLVAAILLFPAMFLLCRELRLRFDVAMLASMLLVFFPNTWFFGGGAFSDVPSLTLVVFAAALFFRGCRDAKAYLLGAFVLALAIGIRPQNLIVGLFPGIVATWYRARANWRDVVFAALIGVTITSIAFGEAAWVTGGVDQYMNTVRVHSDYISRVDSFRAPGRPPLWRLFDRFFIKQYGSPLLSVITSLFVLVSVAGAIRSRDRRIGFLAMTFTPVAVMAWLMLDRFSVTRFALAYIPMFAVLAIDGVRRIARDRRNLTVLGGSALVLAFAIWTLPALTTVRNEVSPSALVVEAARQHLDPDSQHLFVAFDMIPFVQYLDPALPFTRVLDDRAMPLSIGQQQPWLLAEDESAPRNGFVFRRDRGRLWDIARRHYFECGLEPMTRLAQFGDGWYTSERNGNDEWRWMGKQSTTTLPPAEGKSRLRLVFDLPGELIARRPVVTIRLNGAVLDRLEGGPHFEHDYRVEAAPGHPNVLELETTEVWPPANGDPRSLGIQVRYLSWGPD